MVCNIGVGMAQNNAATKSPREQTADVCDEIRDLIGMEENKGAATMTQTEKRAILNELKED